MSNKLIAVISAVCIFASSEHAEAGAVCRHVISQFDYVALAMADHRFDGVLAAIQERALLPSRDSAIRLFAENNLRSNLAEHPIVREVQGGKRAKTSESATSAAGPGEATKVGLFRTAEIFLMLGDELAAGIDGKFFDASRLGEGVFDRCFKAIGLLASSQLIALDLRGTQVDDLTPLAPLTSLEWLNLDGTQVCYLAPLADLVNLKVLSLKDTQVVEIEPLARLGNLEELYLDDTRVSDLEPLADLVNLKTLSLEGTRVEPLTPLAGLTNLARLHLGYLDFEDTVTQLAPLEDLVKFGQLGIYG